MKRGKLAHVGHLDELRRRGGDRDVVEVIATATDEAGFRRHLPDNDRVMLTATASGLRIQVPDESDVDSVLLALRKAGGKLVSVQPVRQSLEELFLDEK